MSAFVTISTYDNPVKANIHKTKLEAHGIQCYLADENTVNANWLWANAIGGIKLRVKTSQKRFAWEILDDDSIAEPAIDDFDLVSDVSLSCPACGSESVSRGRFTMQRSGFAKFLSFFYRRKSLKCSECDYTYN